MRADKPVPESWIPWTLPANVLGPGMRIMLQQIVQQDVWPDIHREPVSDAELRNTLP
jgi:hypothetical protein